MQAILYVCLHRSQARTSLQARKKVCQYLYNEGFIAQSRFSDTDCDYFSVGGRGSGRLSLLRLRHEQPKLFDRFWKRYMASTTDEEDYRLFREMYPMFQGRVPFHRGDVGFYGKPDDAQIMDEPLYQQLKSGFSRFVDYSFELKEPNVIFADDTDEDEWPKTAKEAEKYWVVVIDYHF